MIIPPRDFADRPASGVDLLGTPREFAHPPAPGNTAPVVPGEVQPYDVLSELLRRVRLNGERVAAYGPLGSASAGFSGVGALHIVEEGEVVLRIDGTSREERARCGDVVLLPRGDPHHITDAGAYAHASRA